jgi:hypothetical protein
MAGFGPFPTFSSGGDFYGGISNLVQGFFDQQRFDKWYNDVVVPANIYGTQAADSLGQPQDITQMADQSYGRATSLVGDFSDQNVRDVNQRFDQLGASALANLSARGLGGSTIAPSISYANERNRSDELRRVNDERLNTLLGVESLFGGQQIAASQAATDARLRNREGMILTPPMQTTPFRSAPR